MISRSTSIVLPFINLRDGEEVANHIMIDTMLARMHASASKPKFILVILPYNDVAIYNSIKALANTKHRMHTVCVVM